MEKPWRIVPVAAENGIDIINIIINIINIKIKNINFNIDI